MALGSPSGKVLRRVSEARLLVDQDMTEPELLRISGGLSPLFARRSPKKSSQNEDAVAAIPLTDDALVLAVADGVGGRPDGEQASRCAVEALWSRLGGAGVEAWEGSVREAILSAFEAANAAVMDLGAGAATTLTVLEVRPGSVRPYHAGDSLALLVDATGRVKLRVYALAGLMACVAGLISAGFYQSANTATGEGYELTVIAAAVVGMEKGITVDELAHAIHPHPTLSETVMEARRATRHEAKLGA